MVSILFVEYLERMATTAILYSFRRCPYAMRARLAIHVSGLSVQLREVVLRNKPAEMLALSPKGTVPVLQLADQVLDESLDIMLWALAKHDPENWLNPSIGSIDDALALIEISDGKFKHVLDRYKYADRYPEHSAEYYRLQAEFFLLQLEQLLNKSDYLLSSHACLADMAILPFIRQFAHVDKIWFDQTPYPKLRHWLSEFLLSERFVKIMEKKPQSN